ncbi:MAG: 3-methylmercaptopropionyl-CoA dehydrogenase [Alphaproteobacteria bacterium MarineAlpha5_Bin11]|nr:acyl-CoA dehydrogenase [Pelagibacteraceae bacterium]PPR44617.1 MAG: 3-methylmercaptopropionyl-CoA dehydrogenase [Alphaproteobacteria bacterium MarineAlpha5_Bin11]|tara:strand:+ start:7805 stop:9604 length:1800 start_codon:yes stop_codon:yes gene_type:complete
MQTYKAPLNDMKFILRDFINSESNSLLKNSDIDLSDLEMILEEASKLCEEKLLPLNQSGDEEGCKYENGNVNTPKGFKEIYREFVDNGWQGLTVNKKYGGQELPYFMNMFLDEMISSSNMSFGLYPGLTSNAIDAIEKSASDEIKDLYLPKLASGEWSGTMNLTEPHCGTDLGLTKTIANPQNDGSYKLSGTKIFITCGEHDMSKNIIHLVLAKTPNCPKGIKGISLFVVPKIIPKKDGSLGERNNLECGSIEKKMGINASPTCVMHYNEATGWLVGDLHKGMKAMFIMMNGARLMVGVQGLGIAEIAYQSALNYAKERLQGRSLKGSKNLDKDADPILVHPEIRKSLLKIKTLTEGLRGLMLWTGLQVDIAKKEKDKFKKQNADDWVSLMTPILKSFATDVGCEASNLAVQIYGGHGYIKDHGIEQLVRDSRITPIYEGTNGIQALDLVGRKMPLHTGRLLKAFFHLVKEYIEKNSFNYNLKDFMPSLTKSFNRLQQVTAYIASTGLKDPDEASGPASDYLKMFALVATAYVWTRYAEIAFNKLNNDPNGFYLAKINSGKYFMTKILPETGSIMSSILSGAKTYNDFEDSHFDSAFKL